MTHCSVCGRKLREKVSYHWGGGSGLALRYTDWLNHRRDCTRYGLQPDAEGVNS